MQKPTPETLEKILLETPSKYEVVSGELSNNDLWRWGHVIAKHTRFEILDVLTSQQENRGLKQFILEEHHLKEELSIRDIAKILRTRVTDLEAEAMMDLIESGIQNMETFLHQAPLLIDRRGVLAESGDRVLALNQALSQNPEDKFHSLLTSFDSKALFNFIRSYGLPIRDYENRMNGNGYKKKQGKKTRERNLEWWSDADKRTQLSRAMKGARGTRSAAALESEDNSR